jgi:hypothetical protein
MLRVIVTRCTPARSKDSALLSPTSGHNAKNKGEHDTSAASLCSAAPVMGSGPDYGVEASTP